ncbi:NAD(+) diphosphatase [Enterovibrio nigricans]|uniref:NAD(+) diphosphatase n=1 Tax=Enterovibrio nigricans DSM 22720 TaxID=1121868 RepID=A0A1T4UF71_9GAMM|nr:NAD(+) diphosphatase [Enterovibrio nigricans]PKF51093.1 NAD(+) diphosphatase [Enterovibrio nigricans]SKA51101.1 NAD+ diphosphatase [Enterovibrio nigricans DSM 22720]
MSDRNDLVYLCYVSNGKLWLPDHSLPIISKYQLDKISPTRYVVGCHEGKKVYYTNFSEGCDSGQFESLRALLALPPALFNLAGKAIQLDYMQQTQGFCSCCGGENTFDTNHSAMSCRSCNTVSYPRISPCIIVAVRREGQILLAQHPRHKNGMYTVLAGFVEAGETLEACVAREVKEETGLDVTNIRYFDSQPWAFPSNLMMGFIADYAGGELRPDYEELTDARWFEVNDLPLVAPEGTIAKRLIDAVIMKR